MKIQVISDIHLDHESIAIHRAQGSKKKFERFIPRNEGGADVLVVAGDLHTGVNIFTDKVLPTGETWFTAVSPYYKEIVVVLGNHDFWDGSLLGHAYLWKERLWNLGVTNVHVLDKSCIEIGGVLFAGGTMWTNYNDNPTWAAAAAHEMNDFAYTEYMEGHRLRPVHLKEDHRLFDFFLHGVRNVAARDTRLVVVTHHAPTAMSVDPMYGAPSNSCYYEDMSDHMLPFGDEVTPALWVHGHVHKNQDYMCGNTRVVCNPRGYFPAYLNNKFNPNFIVEV